MLLAAAMLLGVSACHHPDEMLSASQASSVVKHAATQLRPNEGYYRNGKVKGAALLEDIYTKTDLNDLGTIEFTDELVRGLQNQLKLLKYQRSKSTRTAGNLDIEYQQIEETIQHLLTIAKSKDLDPANFLDAYQIKGKDGKGNMYFTGYFTPVLKVSKTQSATYRYPIYTRPKNWQGRLPSRRAIDGDGVLSGLGLELAWAKNPIDVYFMQVQGSGLVQFPDGSQLYLANNGSNGHPYSSIGKYMMKHKIAASNQVSLKGIRDFFTQQPERMEEVLYSNASYVFFTPQNGNPKGAGLVPLSTSYSIAVDKRYIPLGSCVLAKVPVSKKNKVIRHEYRVLLAQDIGGAIKGPGHVDLYTGVGETGRRRASALHHYGSLWLLLPKAQESLAVNL